MNEEEKIETPQEEVKAEVENIVDSEVSEQEPEESSVISEAKATGHLSPEEYKAKHGTLEGYKTPKEFVLTGEVIELKKLVQKRDRDIEQIVNYHQKVVE